MSKLLNKTTATRLKGIKHFIATGILCGEIDPSMSVADFTVLLDTLLADKLKPFEKKIRGLQESGNEDGNWS